ncbi:hypothetical protein RJ641_030262 [Dillenia turbinata]|uniref:Magnesium transporter n=1 Tax=Dillenia turbinata TaxID=194707 RepID=A0AAN8W2W4_9MAGN
MAGDGSMGLPEWEIVMKKTAVSTSWILIRNNGEGTILDVDKYAIMKRVNIHARDLRILDPLLSYPSAILGRERAIVVNLEHIKAIITADEVLLRDPLDENVIPIVEELQRRLLQVGTVSEVQAEEEENPEVRNDVETSERNEFPFEFRALEVALEAICSFLDARTRELETAAYPALDELTSKISSRNLDRVRKLKSAMTRLTNRVQKVRDELEQLLDDDDDMADLYLTRKIASSPVSGSGSHKWFPTSPTVISKMSRTSRLSAATIHGVNDIEELEMLLEAYFMQIEGTVNKLTTADVLLLPVTHHFRRGNDGIKHVHPSCVHLSISTLQVSVQHVATDCVFYSAICHFCYITVNIILVLLQLREYIDDTEDYINIQLDNHRNQLIQLELFLSSGTVCLSIYSLVAAIFGMNIPFIWRDNHGYVFKWVVILSGIASAIIFLTIISYARHKGLVGS